MEVATKINNMETNIMKFLLEKILVGVFTYIPRQREKSKTSLYNGDDGLKHQRCNQLKKVGVQNQGLAYTPLCSSISNGSICCDSTRIRSDIRTHSSTSSVFLYALKNIYAGEQVYEVRHEKIKPYNRKWEKSDELDLVTTSKNPGVNHHCDVVHDVPAVFFSTGGYTGNVYHEFNDGIIPLYITSHKFNKKVVFVILEYHKCWVMRYGNILSHLSDYPPIDFSADNRTHCFTEVIAGLRIHNELTVNPSLMQRQ